MLEDVLLYGALAFAVVTALVQLGRMVERSRTAQRPALDDITAILKRVDRLTDRVNQLELQLTDERLTILDTAEKVAARLADRERKRGSRKMSDDEIDDELLLHPDFALQRAREQYPMPVNPWEGFEQAVNGGFGIRNADPIGRPNEDGVPFSRAREG